MDRALKGMLAEMLHWFHGFCEEQGLTYYILGGTMLGAMRHGGFIPWDDDVDVGMPRGDYVRLEQLLQQMPRERYRLETPTSGGQDFFYPFSKLYDTKTTLLENTRHPLTRGIYLDIFPLDGIGNSKQEAYRNFSAVKWRRRLLLAMTTGIREGRSVGKNLAVRVLRMVPDRLVNRKKLLHTIDAISRGRSFDECAWVGNLMGAWMERELMPREILGKPRLYPFAGMEVYGPEDGEGYLKSLYGDWRSLPPEEKRKSRHDFVYLDLNRSYLDV